MCQGMQLGGCALGWAGREGHNARAEILLGEIAYFIPQAPSPQQHHPVSAEIVWDVGLEPGIVCLG